MNNIRKYERNSLLDDISKLFEQNFIPHYTLDTDNSSLETSQWTPAVDVTEGKDQFFIKVDLPGIDKKNVSIAMDNSVLTIQGERIKEKKTEGENYYRTERVAGRFYRRFALPDTADEEKIQANMSQGVLEIHIPKKAVAKPRSIEIKDD